jgi:hypothetical protein
VAAIVKLHACVWAVGLLRRIEWLMNGPGKDAGFPRCIAETYVQFKRKHNLMKLLEKFK